MRRTTADARSDNAARQIQEIEELERKIKQWSFEVNDGVAGIGEVLQVEADIRGVLEEEFASVVIAEAEKLLLIMAGKHQDMARRHALLVNELTLLENEIENKIVHKMDTEDIKYSIYRLLLTKDKAEIFSEAADSYRSIVDSLTGLKELKQPEGTKQAYLPVKKIIHSEFYTAKVKARLCYEACYQKTMLLNRESRKEELDQTIITEYLKFKSFCANRQL